MMTNMKISQNCCLQLSLRWIYIVHFAILYTLVYSSSIPQCPSGEFTSKGACCKQCPPGHGVITSCGDNNTVCEQCYPDISYSPEWSHTSGCKLCSRCQRNERLAQLCNSSQDTICECRRDYFRDADGTCSQCNMCPPGYGVVVACSTNMDSKCSQCANGTFSDGTSATDFCKPCTLCPEGSTVLQQCTTFSDTLCSGTLKLVGSSNKPAVSTDPTVVLTPRNPKSFSVVPIYCVLLGAVVVGLMIYVIFKRWSFNKVKLRNQKMIRSNTSNSIVGKDTLVETGVLSKSPKLIKSNSVLLSISDRNLQSSRMPLMAVPSTTLYRDLVIEKRMEVEMSLGSTRIDRRDWRGLAEKLGFSEQDVRHYIKTCDTALPVQRMLETWSQNDAATLGALVTALHAINRIDVVDKVPISAYT
ncbi:tumor necrosis factor receptor superfamily member 16-like [Amphiura filiformis]|uniref:tumor necrosis factor receptor superfamily member 16-like n=1 Tax=Amphiura filiformis TaxID=82378 RepID=UPI003B21B1D5